MYDERNTVKEQNCSNRTAFVEVREQSFPKRSAIAAVLLFDGISLVIH
jgi:hypothetical protein